MTDADLVHTRAEIVGGGSNNTKLWRCVLDRPNRHDVTLRLRGTRVTHRQCDGDGHRRISWNAFVFQWVASTRDLDRIGEPITVRVTLLGVRAKALLVEIRKRIAISVGHNVVRCLGIQGKEQLETIRQQITIRIRISRIRSRVGESYVSILQIANPTRLVGVFHISFDIHVKTRQIQSVVFDNVRQPVDITINVVERIGVDKAGVLEVESDPFQPKGGLGDHTFRVIAEEEVNVAWSKADGTEIQWIGVLA
mmetsp:Transcript_9709/g.16223  ORF Transcript_9709/g.16223 Transcript_9709/m.16223 type:complete len:252 (+) Transcript_9709:99-854(+)